MAVLAAPHVVCMTLLHVPSTVRYLLWRLSHLGLGGHGESEKIYIRFYFNKDGTINIII